MWNESKPQDLKGLGLLAIVLLSVYLWRRYKRSQSCTTIPCCGTVCCPGVGECTGCSSCRRIYTPHDSSPRKSYFSLNPFATDSCAKNKTVKIKSCEEPCDGSGPLDSLLCLKNLAQRSVRFYLGESPEGQGGGSCSPCSPTASCSTSLTRCCPRSPSPYRTSSPTVCCSTSRISCCPKYPSHRCTRSRSRCSSTSLTSCCPKYPSPRCTKRAPTCCTKCPIRCRSVSRPTCCTACPSTCCKPCSPACSPICSPGTKPTRSMKDTLREVYSYLGFSTPAPKKSCLKKTDCFKKSVACCKCGAMCSKRDSHKVLNHGRKPSESSFEVTLKNGVMSKPNKVK